MDQLDFLLCGGDYHQDGLLEGGEPGLLVGDNNHPPGGSELAKQETAAAGGKTSLGKYERGGKLLAALPAGLGGWLRAASSTVKGGGGWWATSSAGPATRAWRWGDSS